jgi:hypothetical protein
VLVPSVRMLFALLVGLVTAVLIFIALAWATFLIGGATFLVYGECEGGGCNFVGNAAAGDVGQWVLGIAFFLLAIGAGVAAARTFG